MTLFNFSRWVAKQVTDPKKNADQKIFIVGPAGSGKSMTALALAEAVAYWISVFNHGDPSHASEYFSFDQDHIAVIDNDDLIHLMTTYPKRNSVRVIDDCGAATGFTNRRSMSSENMDVVSIYGTNRVRNTVTIIAVQDTAFTDLRMRVLANEIIDLKDWFQQGPLRFGKLWKIKMDSQERHGYRQARFMTYQHDEWVTIEAIATYMPTPGIVDLYNELRERKDQENTTKLSEKYAKSKEHQTVEDGRPRCPECKSVTLYRGKKNNYTTCRKCGHTF
jgi:hypothetical protein